MALVKKSKLSSGVTARANPQVLSKAVKTVHPAAPKSGPVPARYETVSERIAAATEQLASGLTEAATATRELSQSMEQIATGAEEAAGASQQQSVAIKRISAALGTAKSEADASNRRTETLAVSLAETSAQILNTVSAIERGAVRQNELITVVTELDRRAGDIGAITRAVSRISDQTNLLALNAAIEAARAGENGRGFAVVADEVRTLAETSDRNAREVQQLTQAIQKDVVEVGDALKGAAALALVEAKTATGVAEALKTRREHMAQIAAGSRSILSAAIEAERAATEAQKGAEQIASAAEEQASGAAEAQTAVEQQAKALEESQKAARGLAALAEAMRAGDSRASASSQMGASSEELSASIQELSSAAVQIMAAVEQISKASQLQSSAAQQTSAALAEIERGARTAQSNGKTADERVSQLAIALDDGRNAIDNLVSGVTTSLTGTQFSVATIKRMEGVGRKIEKIIEAIALIAVQTGMLAVSGAVEAARAGEAGRGFAVVSNDIRALSREASENVERAKDTVRGILDQVAVLRLDLEQVIATAELELHNSGTVTRGLQQIAEEVSALGLASRSTLEGADSILTATSEMAKAARQVAAAAEEASAAAREAATASAQQSQGVEDLAAGIEEIASLADELKRQSA